RDRRHREGDGRPGRADRGQGRRDRLPDRARVPERTEPARRLRPVHAYRVLSLAPRSVATSLALRHAVTRGSELDSREQVRTERRGGLLARLRPGEPEAPRDGFEALLRTVKGYNAKADLRELERAYRFAAAAHTGQKRLSGDDFITHPLAVAQILADLGLDTTTLEAALLHDTVEDTPVTLERLEAEFGPDVARLVDGLTKLEHIAFRSREQEQAENVRKMIVAMAGDIRVLLIKLADRLHNMRTLAPLPVDRQRRIATETLEIYAPLAHRLGVQQMKWEMEDLSFKTLHPGPYREIANLVEKRRGERQEYIDQVL